MSLQPNPLHVPELFDSILNFLVGPHPDHQSFTAFSPVYNHKIPEDVHFALVALAQTCRMLSEPSLDRLWCCLCSLRPLVRCFTTEEDMPACSIGEWRLPTSAERAIMNSYSHRVRALYFIDAFSFRCLEQSVFEPNMFPNLRVLSCGLDLVKCNIQPLLGPRLIQLHLVLSNSDHVGLAALLTTCSSHSPDLKSLAFSLQTVMHCPDDLSRAVRSFKKLEHFHPYVLMDSSTLRHFFLSPHITHLHLTITSSSRLHELSLLPSDIPLSRVKELSLRGDIGFITGLLRPEAQRDMVHVCFVIEGQPTLESIHSFFTLLTSGPRRYSLQSLAFETYQLPDEVSLTSDTLQPLYLLNSLRELVINVKSRVSLNDEQLIDLASGWPLLEHLWLDHMDGYSEIHLTFEGLLSLVCVCPRLVDISLPLDGRKIPMSDVCSTSVKRLSFPMTPINDPYQVAQFLMKHFPHIDSFGEVDFWGGDRHVWQKVLIYLNEHLWVPRRMLKDI